MTINVGDKKVSSIYVGDKKISSIYIGDNKVYSSYLSAGTVIWNENRAFAKNLKTRINPEKAGIFYNSKFKDGITTKNIKNGIILYTSRYMVDIDVSSNVEYQKYKNPQTYSQKIPIESLNGSQVVIFNDLLTRDPCGNGNYMSESYTRFIMDNENTFHFENVTSYNEDRRSSLIMSDSNDIRTWFYLMSIDKIEAY